MITRYKFEFTPTEASHWGKIDFVRDDSSILLHISLRPDEGVVVNTKLGGQWGTEERIVGALRAGQSYVLSLELRGAEGTLLLGDLPALNLLLPEPITADCSVQTDLLSHLTQTSGDFEKWVQLGHARKEVGDLSGAAEAYAQATNLRPDDAELALNFGRLLILQGKTKEALTLFRKSHDLDGNSHALNEVNALLGGVSPAAADWFFDMNINDQMKKVLLSGFFDPVWYTNMYSDLSTKFMGPLQHFVEHGGFEWRSPGPSFDTEWYLLQNPDLLPGVEARWFNPLIHFLEYGREEGRRPMPPSPTIVSTVQCLVDDVYDIDPSFYTTDVFIKVKSIPVVDPVPRSRGFAAFKRLFNKLDKPYDFIITVPWLIHGGAELMALNMARAAVNLHGDGAVLVLAVDYHRRDAEDWLPPGVDFLMLQDNSDPLLPGETMECLHFLIQAVQPRCLINVNSMACWEMIRLHGLALSRSVRLYGCAFCRDYNNHNFPAGYADTHVRPSLPYLSGLISDNSTFFNALSEQFQLPPSMAARFIVLYNPAPSAPTRTRRPKSNFKVLWASRFTRQKNLNLLKKIANAAPDIIFDVWGRGDEEAALRECAASCGNLIIKGSYPSFANIPLEEYGAFLYTSLWDGIPNVLLEAAGADLPIVSSNVGGIGELIDVDTGWLIESMQSEDPYVDALREIRDAPPIVESRLTNMRERLKRRHSWKTFIQSMKLAGILERA